jgi:hypothetical protein
MNYWDDWEGFESFVLADSMGYVNRVLYLVRIELTRTRTEGARELGRPSEALQEVLSAARKLASEKRGVASTPSSRELLFCACSLDPQLSDSLQKSGLRFAKLAESVQ